MPTIKKAKIEYDIHDAPSTPLNLQLGVIYAPRHKEGAAEPAGDFDGYSCMEVEQGWFVVAGWGRGRTATILECENAAQAYAELAAVLRMTA